MATFNEDTCMQYTENGGRWFEYRGLGALEDPKSKDPKTVPPDKIPWSSVIAGDFMPVPGSQVAVVFAGWQWRTKLVRTTDAGLNWKIVDRVEQSVRWFAAHGSCILLLSRLLPGAPLATYVAAGFLRLPIERFLAITGVVSLVWTVIVLVLTQFSSL